jgi:hypothetical protein
VRPAATAGHQVRASRQMPIVSTGMISRTMNAYVR